MRYIKFLWLFAIALSFSAQAHPGIGIVMDSKGNVFYTDLKQVWRIDTQGNKSIVVPSVHTHELFIDEQDNLYGEHLWYEGERTDKWGHYVWRYSANGVVEKIIPDTEGFLNGYSFVRDHYGNMYWADYKQECQHVVRKEKNGAPAKLSNSCFRNIRWMTATPGGTVYLIDLHDLKKIDRVGRVETIASQLSEPRFPQFFINDVHQVMGLCTDSKENVYAAVYGARKVVKVTPDGKIFTVMQTGMSWSPTGVLSAPNGDLWVLECSPTNNVRVERITTDGRRIIY